MKKPLGLLFLVIASVFLMAQTGPVINRMSDIPDSTGLRTATNNQVPGWNNSTRKWVPITPPGAAGGEANDGANIGGGFGVFWDKSGLNLRFRSLTNVDDSIAVSSNGTMVFFGAGASVPRLAYTNNFSGPNTLTNLGNTISGNGTGLTNLNGSSIASGTISDARIPDNITIDLATVATTANAGDSATAFFSSGTLEDARLSANVPLKDATQTFSGANALTNLGNTISGNGAGLTNLNGSNIASGTVADARIASTIHRDDEIFDGDLVSFDDADNKFTATDVDSAISEFDNVNGSGPNASDGKVHWTQLVGVPAGFADGTDDGAGGGSGDVLFTDFSQTFFRTNGAAGNKIYLTNLTTGIIFDGTILNEDIADDTIAVGKMADGDWGDFTITGNVAAIDANAVALGTDTTGNYIATIAGTSFRVSVSGSGSETAAVTLDIDATGTLAGNPGLAGNGIGFGTTGIIFEGATANTLEGLITADDVTADRTWTLPDRTGTFILSGDTFTGDVTATLDSDGGTVLTIAANSVALATDTTGNYVNDVAGTANEVSVSHTPSEGSTATISLPAVIDLGGKTSLEIPNAAAPTVNVFGQIAGDNNLWASGRGAPVFYDGTAAVALVGTLVSDTPSNGQVPMWTTGGLITWETISGSGDVVGPSSAVDNQVARYDGTTGKLIQTSSATIGDTGIITADSIILTNGIQNVSTGMFTIYAIGPSFTNVISVTEPTAARATVFPDRGGTISLSGDTFTGDVTGTLSSSGATALTIGANTVALGTDTTGNYAAGDAEAGAALTGDSATAFFTTGQIERARGGLGTDTSAFGAGLIGSDGSNNTIDVDTAAELETALGAINIILSTEIDTSAEIAAIVGDEQGSGALVFATSPTLTTPVIGVATGTSLALGADPADAGVLRLENAAVIGWEASPAGTDVTLTVNSSGVFVFSSTVNATSFTGAGGALTVTASGFDGNLTTSDDTLQEIAQKLDDLIITGSGDAVLIDGVAVTDGSGVNFIGGTGIDFTFNSGVSPDTATAVLDLTELQGGTTVGDGSSAAWTLTFNIDAADPTLEARDDGTIVVSRGAAGSGLIAVTEDTDNGTSIGMFTAVANLTANRTWTGPDLDGTIALTANNLSVFAATTGAQIAGVSSDETGSGVLVFSSAPTITNATFSGNITNLALTASQDVVTDANKALASNPITGTGNGVRSSGSIQTNATFAASVTNTFLTASQAVFTGANKELVSVAATGSGNVMRTRIGVVRSTGIPMGAWYTNNINGSLATLLSFTNVGDAYGFVDGATNTVNLTYPMPITWDVGTVQFSFSMSTATTNTTSNTNVVFSIRAASAGNAQSWNPLTFGTAITFTNHIHKAAWTNNVCVTPAITIGNTPGVNKPVVFELSRITTDATDVNTNRIDIVMSQLFYTETATEATMPTPTN